MSENTSIQKQSSGGTLAELIASKRDAFAKVAAKHYDPDRLVKLAQAALSRNPGLLKCTPISVLNALMKCAELGLEPDSALPQRRMWLVPRWNSKINATECTPQMDYRAQLQLARDTGMVTSIVASEVRKEDVWDYSLSPAGESMTSFTFKPNVFGDRGPIIGYFAAARLASGEVQVVAISKVDAENHRDRFAPKKKDGSAASSPWVSDFDAMALKSALRKLWNLLPAGKSAEAQKVQAAASEEETTAATMEIELPALPAEAPAGGRTDALKARLKKAVATIAEPPPAPAEEPKEEASPFNEDLPEQGELEVRDEVAGRTFYVKGARRG